LEPVTLTILGVVEAGLTIYDLVSLAQIYLDPCSSAETKATATALTLAAVVGVGGGTVAILAKRSKVAKKAISKKVVKDDIPLPIPTVKNPITKPP